MATSSPPSPSAAASARKYEEYLDEYVSVLEGEVGVTRAHKMHRHLQTRLHSDQLWPGPRRRKVHTEDERGHGETDAISSSPKQPTEMPMVHVKSAKAAAPALECSSSASRPVPPRKMATWCGLVLAAWFWLTSLAAANHMVLDQFGNTLGEIAPEKETLAGKIASFLQTQSDVEVPPKHNLASVCHEKADMNKFMACQMSVVEVPCKYSNPFHRVLEGERAMKVAEAFMKWKRETGNLAEGSLELAAYHKSFSWNVTDLILNGNPKYVECIRIGQAIEEYEDQDFVFNIENGVIPLLMKYVGDTKLCCEIAQLGELKDYVTDCGDSLYSPAQSNALEHDDVYVGTALLSPSGDGVRVPSGRRGVPSLRFGSQTLSFDRQQLIEKTMDATPGEHHWEDRCIFLSVHSHASEVSLAVATDVSAPLAITTDISSNPIKPQYAIRIFTLFDPTVPLPSPELPSPDSKWLQLPEPDRYERKIFDGNIEDEDAVFGHMKTLFADRQGQKASLLQRERLGPVVQGEYSLGAGINGFNNFLGALITKGSDGNVPNFLMPITGAMMVVGSVITVLEVGTIGLATGTATRRTRFLGAQWKNWWEGQFGRELQ